LSWNYEISFSRQIFCSTANSKRIERRRFSSLLSKIIHLSLHEHHSSPFSSKCFTGIETSLRIWLLAIFLLLFEEWYFSFFKCRCGWAVEAFNVLVYIIVVDVVAADGLTEFIPFQILRISLFIAGKENFLHKVFKYHTQLFLVTHHRKINNKIIETKSYRNFNTYTQDQS